jgi:hypothetical protein
MRPIAMIAEPKKVTGVTVASALFMDRESPLPERPGAFHAAQSHSGVA